MAQPVSLLRLCGQRRPGKDRNTLGHFSRVNLEMRIDLKETKLLIDDKDTEYFL